MTTSPHPAHPRLAIITGADSGMGKATAYLAARLGADIAICGRDPDKLARVADGIRAAGAALALIGAS